MTQARTLSKLQVDQCLREARTTRERVILLLSIRAGLRAKEIAALSWDRIDWAERELLLIETKGDKPRHVPMSDDLHDALAQLRDDMGDRAAPDRPVLPGQLSRKGQHMSANTLAQWLGRYFRERMGWEGYSSHSGRRTFITNAARKITSMGGSIKDVQILAGHSDLKTTSAYIDTNKDAQRKVVNSI